MRQLFLLSSLSLLVLASAADASAQGKPDAAAGGALAQRWCSSCHLVAPAQNNAPAAGAPSFMALGADTAVSADQLRGFLNKPHPPMPDPGLTRQEIENVVAYIVSLR